MSEKYLMANGLHLCYEEFGKPDNPAIVLIMGLGTQMIAWPQALCEGLAEQGYRVIRFDNRDVGLSQKVKSNNSINLLKIFAFSKIGLNFDAPYSLSDMAADAVGVLDALDIEKAHWVGASLGGMIAQQVTAKYPERCLTLTSIMSTTSNPKLKQPSLATIRTLLQTPSKDTEAEYLKNSHAKWVVFGSPDYPPRKDELTERILNSYRRSYYPQGFKNQIAAMAKTGDRSQAIKTIRAPTLVIHGKQDKLIPVEGGIDTAALIEGSTIKLIEGMGHDLPKELMPKFVRMISAHTDGVSKSRKPRAAA